MHVIWGENTLISILIKSLPRIDKVFDIIITDFTNINVGPLLEI